MAHWVEDDPAGGDGAFSSAGLFGFYPWINATKTHYGVLSRKAAPAAARLMRVDSRLAFDNGTAQ